MTFWPFLGPPVTESEKWIISSYASVTNQKPNQKPKYYLLIWFIWFIFSHCKCFWAHFWPFLSLQCLKLGPRFIWQMQYMDLNTKVYYLSEESAIKLTLIIDSFQCFSICLCYGPFEPLGGGLWGRRLSHRVPQGPYEVLTLHSYLHPVYGAPASSLGFTCGFF